MITGGVSPKTIDRWFARRVVQVGDCWVWIGARTGNGYGQAGIAGRSVMVHRAVYQYMVAVPPVGLDLDHLCRTRACCNPWHLDPVPRGVNLKRSGLVGKYNSRKAECPHGHPYNAANTRMTRAGKRQCRTCERQRAQRIRDNKAATWPA